MTHVSAHSDAVRAVYAQVGAPQWAAPNLDALADVLRDLSWLPSGPVTVQVAGDTPQPVQTVLARAVAETADTSRPIRLLAPR